jgi:hypothetical protein
MRLSARPVDGSGAGRSCIDKSMQFRLTDGVPLVVAGVNDAGPVGSTRSWRTRTARRFSSPASSSRCTRRGASASVRLADVPVHVRDRRRRDRELRATEPAEGDLAMDWESRRAMSFSEESKLRAETARFSTPELPLQAASACGVAEPRRATRRGDCGSRPSSRFPPKSARECSVRAACRAAGARDAERRAGRDEVLVGRIRPTPCDRHGPRTLSVNDNLRKGAGLNAVQIAEALLERRLVRA